MIELNQLAFEGAAAEVRVLLQGLRQTAPSRIALLLECIERNLFDRRLTIKWLKQQCHVRDNSFAIYFRRSVGQAPAAFIATCRQRVAKALLAETQIPLWQISELLGYSTLSIFSRAFIRQTGIRPYTFRRNAGISAASKAAPAVDPHVTWLFRAWRGQLTDHEVAHVFEHLGTLYPSYRLLLPVAELPPDGASKPASLEE